MLDADAALDAVYRSDWGRIVATLIGQFGDFDLAEEAAQDAFGAAAGQWREAGVPDSKPREQLMKGFEVVCAMPIAEGRKLVSHPVVCVDCHEPKSMQLRVSRPGFLNGIARLAESDAGEYPHLPSIMTWRKGKREKEYDPNTMATRQEMRSLPEFRAGWNEES